MNVFDAIATDLGEEATTHYATEMVKALEKDLEKAHKSGPKFDRDVEEYKANKMAYDANVAELEREIGHWRQVAEVEARRKAAVEEARQRAEAARVERAKARAEEVKNKDKEATKEEREVLTQLSTEKDPYGNPFVVAADGTTVFGMIDAESGLAEAPIRLSQGEMA